MFHLQYNDSTGSYMVSGFGADTTVVHQDTFYDVMKFYGQKNTVYGAIVDEEMFNAINKEFGIC